MHISQILLHAFIRIYQGVQTVTAFNAVHVSQINLEYN